MEKKEQYLRQMIEEGDLSNTISLSLTKDEKKINTYREEL